MKTSVAAVVSCLLSAMTSGALDAHARAETTSPSTPRAAAPTAGPTRKIATPPAPTAPQVASLAAGCFWGTEEFFRKVPGVISTRVGYTGGHSENPTYEDTSSGTTGHAETLELTFNPAQVTYAELLTLFFKMHDPTTANRQGNDVGTQYRSAIFYRDEGQRRVAAALMQKIEKSGAWRARLTTELAPAGVFYPAEEYHQRYLVKHPGGYDNHYLRTLSFD
jgi:methionine-S-sulfoxide reductase